MVRKLSVSIFDGVSNGGALRETAILRECLPGGIIEERKNGISHAKSIAYHYWYHKFSLYTVYVAIKARQQTQ